MILLIKQIKETKQINEIKLIKKTKQIKENKIKKMIKMQDKLLIFKILHNNKLYQTDKFKQRIKRRSNQFNNQLNKF